MRKLFYSIVVFLISCQSAINNKSQFYLPAEWEPHKAVIVSFDNDLYGDSVSVEMVKNLYRDTKIYCLIANDTLIPFYTNWFKKGKYYYRQH